MPEMTNYMKINIFFFIKTYENNLIRTEKKQIVY